eukprot:1128966-Pelagomonas_calceolata.AAC.1
MRVLHKGAPGIMRVLHEGAPGIIRVLHEGASGVMHCSVKECEGLDELCSSEMAWLLLVWIRGSPLLSPF